MKRGSRKDGFTLVEVVLALGLAATAIVVLLALLPATADAVGDGHRTGRAVACLELVLADVRAADQDDEGQWSAPRMVIVLPEAGESSVETIYFDADCEWLPEGETDDALFRVRLEMRRTGVDEDVVNIDCEARWPAAEEAAGGGSVNVWGVREL